MTGLLNGIAHVSFLGGGIVLPARNPYDRQVLVEHVVDRVRKKGRVQVLVDDQRWMVHLDRNPGALACARCADSLGAACYAAGSGGAAYCVECAFGTNVASVSSQHESQRLAG